MSAACVASLRDPNDASRTTSSSSANMGPGNDIVTGTAKSFFFRRPRIVSRLTGF